MADARPRILVDADACPVKDEVCRVAWRRGATVLMVSDSWLRLPVHEDVSQLVVEQGPDAADDAIAEAAGPDAVVITADIPLAARALEAGALALSPKGRGWDARNIGDALATRSLMSELRAGVGTPGAQGGPAPFAKEDRSRFLQALDAALVALERRSPT